MKLNCTISTPQFRQDQKSGWTWNNEQQCYQKMFTQSGTIDTETWEFEPDELPVTVQLWESLLGRHKQRGWRVSFYSETEFLKAKVA